MKTISKHIIIFSGFSIFFFLGYIAFQNTNIQSSQSDETNESLSQSDKEAHTGKSLNIVSQSGGEWGNNPFATGTTSSGNIKKLEFVKPNTEWKTRTLSGITYVFGEGNPKEVALDVNQLEKYFQNIAPQNDYGDYGYVTMEVEKLLFELLSHPSLPLFIECFPRDSIPSSTESSQYLNFFDMVRPGFFDLDSFLFVDQHTGRKELNTAKLISLVWFLRDQAYPVESSENTQVADSCKQKNGAILYQIAEKLRKKYSNF